MAVLASLAGDYRLIEEQTRWAVIKKTLENRRRPPDRPRRSQRVFRALLRDSRTDGRKPLGCRKLTFGSVR